MNLRDRLRRFERELETSESSMTEAQRTLADAQTTVKQLAQKKALLEEIHDEISVGRAVVDGQRDLLAGHRQEIDAILAVPRALHAPDAGRSRAEIDAVINAIDTRIEALRKRGAARARDVAAADRAADRATEAATLREARYARSREELRQLPGQITTVQARITELTAAGKAALDNGRMAEAYVLASDLGTSLQRWKRLTNRRHEERLAARLVREWQELDAARAAAASKAGVVDELRRELSAVESELQSVTRARDAEIKAKLPAIAARARAPRAPRPAARRRPRAGRRARKRRRR